MAHAKLLQGWTTLNGSSGSTTITQQFVHYADLLHYKHVVAFLEVSNVTNPCNLNYETAPSPDDSLFQAMTATVVPSVGVTVTRLLYDTASVPLARYFRWKIAGAPGGAWSMTFRIWIVCTESGTARRMRAARDHFRAHQKTVRDAKAAHAARMLRQNPPGAPTKPCNSCEDDCACKKGNAAPQMVSPSAVAHLSGRVAEPPPDPDRPSASVAALGGRWDARAGELPAEFAERGSREWTAFDVDSTNRRLFAPASGQGPKEPCDNCDGHCECEQKGVGEERGVSGLRKTVSSNLAQYVNHEASALPHVRGSSVRFHPLGYCEECQDCPCDFDASLACQCCQEVSCPDGGGVAGGSDGGGSWNPGHSSCCCDQCASSSPACCVPHAPPKPIGPQPDPLASFGPCEVFLTQFTGAVSPTAGEPRPGVQPTAEDKKLCDEWIKHNGALFGQGTHAGPVVGSAGVQDWCTKNPIEPGCLLVNANMSSVYEFCHANPTWGGCADEVEHGRPTDKWDSPPRDGEPFGDYFAWCSKYAIYGNAEQINDCIGEQTFGFPGDGAKPGDGLNKGLENSEQKARFLKAWGSDVLHDDSGNQTQDWWPFIKGLIDTRDILLPMCSDLGSDGSRVDACKLANYDAFDYCDATVRAFRHQHEFEIDLSGADQKCSDIAQGRVDECVSAKGCRIPKPPPPAKTPNLPYYADTPGRNPPGSPWDKPIFGDGDIDAFVCKQAFGDCADLNSEACATCCQLHAAAGPPGTLHLCLGCCRRSTADTPTCPLYSCTVLHKPHFPEDKTECTYHCSDEKRTRCTFSYDGAHDPCDPWCPQSKPWSDCAPN